ncbi:homeodomain transcription factor [Mycena latifolia]|nr:homeodomain transcription factor [Mycena latifolia]
MSPLPPQDNPAAKPRGTRHRHSAVQLAALNSVYEQSAHPTLNQRTELAQSLGLEIKSVNAFFQNKRASSKKLARGSPYDALGMSHPDATHPRPYSSMDDDYYYPPVVDAEPQHFRSQALHRDQDTRPRNLNVNQLHVYPPGDQGQYLSDMSLQIDELLRIYRTNAYPSAEEMQLVAERLGTRYQSITEWFRTQRSLDRRGASTRVDGYPGATASISISPVSDEDRAYLTLPPINLPPASSHPSLLGERRRLPPLQEERPYIPRPRRRSSSPRSAASAPYGSTSSSNSTTSSSTASLSARQRRGRPDPVQLTSLRRLLSKTPTPSIEERSALAREIGMDLGKVTNWFRNLRQSARKRERKSTLGRGAGAGGSDDEYENDHEYGGVYLSSTSRSASASRSETPSVECALLRRQHSSDEEEDAQEAVTPASSPPPGRGRPPDLHMRGDDKALFSRVPYEDAMLLLGFHRLASIHA